MALVNKNRFNTDPRKISTIPEIGDFSLPLTNIGRTEELSILDGKKINDIDDITGKEILDPNRRNIFDKGFDLLKNGDGDILGSALDIIPTGIGALMANKNSRDFFDASKLEADDVDFRLGQVTDLAKPNFATPTRAPQGSSLAERESIQKFGDVNQIVQEANFEIQNSANRIGQRDRILDRENRGKEFNASRRDNINRFNAGVAVQRGTTSKALEHELLAGTLANLNTRRSENAQIKGSQDAISAGELIRKGIATTYPEAIAMVKKAKNS